MYTPKSFQCTDTEAINAFIRQNGFAVLVSHTDKFLATHIPLELSDDNTRLYGHLAKANPQGKGFSHSPEVLAIFQGPHAYISSSWYNHENVPTWNYMAVHVYGTLRILEGERLYNSLTQLTNRYEQQSRSPVSLEKMSAGYVERQMRAVIGFEIEITSTTASYKLSQNRSPEDHANIIRELEARGDANALAIAKAMKEKKSLII